jgi:aspartyl/asparaginyl beta-hydroxylase (cupin superfamily)
MVLALEPDLTDLVRETKFRVFNAEWLNAVENDDDHDQVCFHGTVCDSLLTMHAVRAPRWRRISVSQLQQHLG